MRFMKLIIVLMMLSGLVYGSLDHTMPRLAHADDRCAQIDVENSKLLSWTQDSNALVLFSRDDNTFLQFDIETEVITQSSDLLDVDPLAWQSGLLAFFNDPTIIWNQEGTIAVQLSDDDEVNIHFIEDEPYTLILPETASYFALNADGSYLATTLGDDTITIWDIATTKPEETLEDISPNDFYWNPDNPRQYAIVSIDPASSTQSSMVTIWDVIEVEPLQTLQVPPDDTATLTRLNEILWSSDGTHILGDFYGFPVYVTWEVTTGEHSVVASPPLTVTSQWYEVGVAGLSLDDGHDVVVWDVMASTEIERFTFPDFAQDARLSPDGQYLAVNYGQGLLSICHIGEAHE